MIGGVDRMRDMQKAQEEGASAMHVVNVALAAVKSGSAALVTIVTVASMATELAEDYAVNCHENAKYALSNSIDWASAVRLSEIAGRAVASAAARAAETAVATPGWAVRVA